MPAASADTVPASKAKYYKMKLTGPTFSEELGGKLPAGSVVVVDEDTAIRWLDKNIATQAGRDEKTAREIRRAELAAALVPVEEGVYDAAVTREPRQVAARRTTTTRPRAGGAVKPELRGADVINSLEDMPDDEHPHRSDADEDDE